MPPKNTKPRILLLNGPNLNLLGTRETSIYGAVTLDQIEVALGIIAQKHGALLETFQSNTEGVLVDRIQQAQRDNVDFVLINPAAYTHTSVAIRDALAAVQIPFIEIHLSNIYQRESFRHHSYVSALATGTIAGLGPAGYRIALMQALDHLAGRQWPVENQPA